MVRLMAKDSDRSKLRDIKRSCGNEEMMQMTEARMKCIRDEAKRLKAIAVEKYNAGDLAGAKEFAVKAKELDPELRGLRRLNTVLDVRMGFEKKNNGEVDWSAVLAVDPTADDLKTIHDRFINLYLTIVLDKDDSIGSTEEATEILADAWTYFKESPEVIPPPRSERCKQRARFMTSVCVDKFRKRSARIRRDRTKLKKSVVRSALVEKAKSKVKLSLERFASSSLDKNVDAAAQ